MRIVLVVTPRLKVFDEKLNKNLDGIEFTDATEGGEIFPPGDNPNVITVGSLNRASATSKGKPEVILEKTAAIFDDGVEQDLSSTATGFFAGIVAVLKSHKEDLTREDILAFAKSEGTLRSGEAAPPIEEVSLDEIRNAHPGVVAEVQKSADGAVIKPGRHADGHFVLGINKVPLEVIKKIDGDAGGSAFEYYLTEGAVKRDPDTERLTRKAYVERRKTKDSEFPWETNRRDPWDYVEVREIKAKVKVGHLWKTPTPSELKKR